MSTSKKPGTDLAALKARLAKKTKGKEEPEVAASPPQQFAPASEPLPAPGHAAPAVHAQRPVERYADPQHLPPPGVAAHQHVAPQPMGMGHAAPAVAPSDDPFGAGSGTFDPSEGMVDIGGGGDVASKGGFGLMIFAGVLGGIAGVAGGYLGRGMVENKDRVEKGRSKGEEMVAAVTAISSARIDVANRIDELEKQMGEDPIAASQQIEALLAEKWDTQVNISQLFGWQLAAVHPNGVKNSFELFEEASRVKKDLQYLQAFLASQPEALQKGQGPSTFAVMFTSSGANLVAALGPMCAAAEGAPPAPCGDGDFSKAVAYSVIDSIGGTEPKVVPRGTGEGQAILISPDGGVYAYAVGLEPNRNAVIYRNGMVMRIREHLEAMAKIEKIALKSLEKYAEEPTVDGSSEQPDPEAAGEGQ